MFGFFIQSREDDVDRDGRKDFLHLTLQMDTLDTEKVLGLQLLVFFRYSLQVE